jgi:hypothetical protein
VGVLASTATTFGDHVKFWILWQGFDGVAERRAAV